MKNKQHLSKKIKRLLCTETFVVTDHKPLVTLFAPDKGTPAMAANRLAQWALLVHQYDYRVEYRRSKDLGNADEDVNSVCLVRTISRQIKPDNPLFVVRETAKDSILSQVMRFVKEGWPVYVIIFLNYLHLGHLGVQRIKQLARSTVYWPRIDLDIENLCRKCTSCSQFQNKPVKPSIHPWMMPEKPWSRLHRIRTKIDTLVPSIPHLLQGRQASKHSNAEDSEVVSKVEYHYTLGDPCYALYFGSRRDRDPRWVLSVNVRVIPRGPTLKTYGSDQNDDPCDFQNFLILSHTYRVLGIFAMGIWLTISIRCRYSM